MQLESSQILTEGTISSGPTHSGLGQRTSPSFSSVSSNQECTVTFASREAACLFSLHPVTYVFLESILAVVRILVEGAEPL